MKSTGKTLLTFFTGAAAGVVAGVLLAPKSGKNFRTFVSESAGSMMTGGRQKTGNRKESKQSTIIPIENYSKAIGS